jgi:hypothetical protein
MNSVQLGTCNNVKDFIYESYNINIIKLFIEWLYMWIIRQHR